MGRVEILCESDRELMLDFSGLCMGRFADHLLLRRFVPLFQRFLDANVMKEIEKDRLIIEHAATAFAKGADSESVDLDGLFEATVRVDDEFLKKLATPFFSIAMRYDDLALVRKMRMASFVRMVYDLLSNWRDPSLLTDIVRITYAEKRYREILGEILHLYNVETRLLSNSLTVHGPVRAAKDLFAEGLFAVMERAAQDVSTAYARKIYAGIGPLFEAGAEEEQ